MSDIVPMLATPSTGTRGRRPISYDELMGSGQWAADLKLDGVRALLYWDGHATRLMNRNGVNITTRYPDVTFSGPPVVLDGEIVADDGSFESLALRDRQQTATGVARLMAQIPVKFIAFDLLAVGGAHMLASPWSVRRQHLDEFTWPDGFSATIWSPKPAMLQTCRELGFEGVIVKRLSAGYQPGRRSPDWVKFKNLHRVSCIPVGYEPGIGARAHFGAMHLAMLDTSGPVVVGRVGTGFTETEILELKGRLDRRELFVVEIECLNRTKDNQLRFPVYRGIRSDLTPQQITIDQLRALPSC